MRSETEAKQIVSERALDVSECVLVAFAGSEKRTEWKAMKKLKLIALFISAVLVEITTPVSLYTIISDAEHVAHDNRLPKKLQPVELMVNTRPSVATTADPAFL